MDFVQSFRNAYSGLKEGTEEKNQLNCTICYENIIFSPNLLAISFAPTACLYRRTLCKLMSKFFDQY